MLGVGASKKTYVDDVFSTFIYEGNGYHPSVNPSGATSRDIVNGIDFTEGGLAIFNTRNQQQWWQWVDTVNGATNSLASNSNNALDTNRPNGLKTFNNNGFTIGYDSLYNVGNADYDYSSWSFRKSPAFTIKQYSGTGSAQTLSHDLGSIPGMIMCKCTSTTGHWRVYHRSLGEDGALVLNSTNGAMDDSDIFGTTPTSTNFYVGNDSHVNTNGETYIAYIFAGGESTAATARSVYFSGTASTRLTIPDSDDFDLGSTFTIETWVKPDYSSNNGYYEFFNHGNLRLYVRDYNDGVFDCGSALGGDLRSSKGSVPEGQWTHVALVVNSGIAKLYVNGVNDQNANRTGINLSGTGQASIGAAGGGYFLEGSLSNFRIVKGTAVYTSSFRPPTEPLTNITNTVLLCCNDSSVTGSTVTPNTISSNGTITASSDSPFDDPAGFVFGESGSENVIKTGSYTGNGVGWQPTDSPPNLGLFVECGFEPQWIIVKRTSPNGGDWKIVNCMTGMGHNVTGETIAPNNSNASEDGIRAWAEPTGFRLGTSSSQWNYNGGEYIFCAVRRSDGYVGKQYGAGEGTSVFAMDTGSAGNVPAFDSGFPVDFAFTKNTGTSEGWYTSARNINGKALFTNTDAAETSNAYIPFDTSNTGYGYNLTSTYQAWMWKRGAGMDVVCYEGTGSTQVLSHSLGKNVEMAWIKRRDGTADWKVYHSGLDSSNPENYNLTLNSVGVRDYSTTRFGAPSSTHFTVKTHATTNGSGNSYLMMLFASVDGISKVGYYDGSASTQTITTGFQPRFVIIKKTSGSADWLVLDTTRGWTSGNDAYLHPNTSAAQQSDHDFGAPTSTGFTLTSVHTYNGSGGKYIYYAHA